VIALILKSKAMPASEPASYRQDGARLFARTRAKIEEADGLDPKLGGDHPSELLARWRVAVLDVADGRRRRVDASAELWLREAELETPRADTRPDVVALLTIAAMRNGPACERDDRMAAGVPIERQLQAVVRALASPRLAEDGSSRLSARRGETLGEPNRGHMTASLDVGNRRLATAGTAPEFALRKAGCRAHCSQPPSELGWIRTGW
jgi:hypothetical protein